MRHYCTYFDINYIKQGLALHESMEAHCQPYHLWILALDDDAWTLLIRRILPNTTTVKMEAFETARLRAVRPTRTWREYIWTLTGSWMLWVMRRQKLDHVSYIDADCFFFSSPDPVFEEIGDAPLAITPHRFPPHRKHFEVNGLYNVGLVYATKAGLPCIEEYAELCLEWCYYKDEDGKFADQKYWDELVPKYNVHPIQHLGANLAPWNQEAYQYLYNDTALWVQAMPDVVAQRLIWYHFHQGFDPKWPIAPALTEWVYPRYKEAWERQG